MQTEPSTASRAGLSGEFGDLMAALDEGIAFARGERELTVTTLTTADPPPAYGADRVRRLRLRLGMSQPRFSRLLNVSPKTVQSWEQGTRVPSHSSARLLQVIENPGLLASLAAPQGDASRRADDPAERGRSPRRRRPV
jgi:putative transcriptional regulator